MRINRYEILWCLEGERQDMRAKEITEDYEMDYDEMEYILTGLSHQYKENAKIFRERGATAIVSNTDIYHYLAIEKALEMAAMYQIILND